MIQPPAGLGVAIRAPAGLVAVADRGCARRILEHARPDERRAGLVNVAPGDLAPVGVGPNIGMREVKVPSGHGSGDWGHPSR